MTSLRLVLCAGLALALVSAAGPPSAAAQPAPVVATPGPEVDPDAIQALTRMSAYLSTLTAFEITAETSQDLVLTDGQKVKVDGVNRYIVRRPNAFVVEVATPYKVRRLLYDGKSLTLHAPELGYYATVEAPGTIRETLKAAEERYGLHVPMQDLFRWTDPSINPPSGFSSALRVGPAKLEGVDADHYAFRQDDMDWQIWIRKGAQPVPLKVVIIDGGLLERPQYEARLRWAPSPQLTSDTFAFRPPADALQIRLSSLNP